MDRQVWANVGLEEHGDFSLWTDRSGQMVDWRSIVILVYGQTGMGNFGLVEHIDFSLWTDRSGQTLDWRSIVILVYGQTGLGKHWTGGA